MKKFEIYVSVNDDEYVSTITVYGNSCTVAPKTIEGYYPVTIDNFTMYFEEFITAIECDSKEIFDGYSYYR